MLNARIDQLFELNEAHESDLSVASEVTQARVTEALKVGAETYEGELEMDNLSNDRRIEMAPASAAVTSTKGVKERKPLPAPNNDFYELYETLSAEEFMEAKVAPVITKYWVDDAFPFELLPGVKELGIGGLAMQGYGCAGGSLYRIGLVNEIVPAANLITRAEAILKQIAANAPIAVKFALEAANKGMETSQSEGLLLEASYFGLCAATEDKKEGTTAFLEKRAPQFHGR